MGETIIFEENLAYKDLGFNTNYSDYPDKNNLFSQTGCSMKNILNINNDLMYAAELGNFQNLSYNNEENEIYECCFNKILSRSDGIPYYNSMNTNNIQLSLGQISHWHTPFTTNDNYILQCSSISEKDSKINSSTTFIGEQQRLYFSFIY